MQHQYGTDKLKWIYSRMTLIREFDERVQHNYLLGKIAGAIHVYCGEEAVAVGVCAHLQDSDYVTGTHRSHGHCLAKGIGPGTMMAELYGKVTGICRGKGGSMHIIAPEVGMLGANGIVAAGLPIACGAALSAKFRRSDQVAVAFLGDGASNSGGFYESLNLAAIFKLPVVFVLENNLFADATRISFAAAVENLSERARAFALPGVTVDGSDVFEVLDAAGEAIDRARKDNTPTLLECKTYRYYGHFVGDAGLYRTKEEVEEQRRKDCILRFENRVLDEGWLERGVLGQLKQESVNLISEAIAFAENSPFPKPEDCADDVYVSY